MILDRARESTLLLSVAGIVVPCYCSQPLLILCRPQGLVPVSACLERAQDLEREGLAWLEWKRPQAVNHEPPHAAVPSGGDELPLGVARL